MPDTASQANKLRLLEQKRLKAGLSPEEEARRASLAAEAPAPRGFDVKAAAAHIRALLESEAPPQALPARLEPPAAAPAPARSRSTDASAPPARLPETSRSRKAEPFPETSPSRQAEPLPADETTCAGAATDQLATPVEAAQDAGVAPQAPVYDAAAYGLDPNDPTAVAWAAWYASQGWDPATAYAYAQRMNSGAAAGADGEAAVEAAAREPGADSALGQESAAAPAFPGPVFTEREAPSDALPDGGPAGLLSTVSEQAIEGGLAAPPEMLAEALSSQPADEEVALAGAPSDEPSAELPPLELAGLDEPAGEAPAGQEQPDSAIDIGASFGLAPRADRTAPDDLPPPADSVAVDAALTSDWASHAVPLDDEPVDVSAFEAEPAVAPASEPRIEAARGGMWELADALQREPAAQDEPSDHSEAQLPTLEGFAPFEAPAAGGDAPWAEALPPAEAGYALSAPAAGDEEHAVEPLEPLAPEPLAIDDGDILEVGEEVVELAEAAPPAAAGLPSSASTSEPPSAATVGAPVSDVAIETPPAPAHEPTASFDEIPPSDPGPVAAAWNTPPEPIFEAKRASPAASTISGTHRVVIHTADGQVRRGTVSDVELESGEVLLTAQGGMAAAPVPVREIKAIFFMLPAGEKPAEPSGKKVRVTFRDGRQVAGFSADYDPERPGFFMVPSDTRTHTARIWVYQSAVRQISVY